MRLQRSVQLKLSCYKCGGIDFENIPIEYNVVENKFYFLKNDNAKVKCVSCGLEDYAQNLVPRAYLKEELVG